jgi:hypothetical protein
MRVPISRPFQITATGRHLAGTRTRPVASLVVMPCWVWRYSARRHLTA